MAKPTRQDYRYGISVAARIDPELAHAIAKQAQLLGVSMAKMVAHHISQGYHSSEKDEINGSTRLQNHEDSSSMVKHLQRAIEKQKKIYSQATAEFIARIAVQESDQKELISIFNQVLIKTTNRHDPT